jgi:hypothetical protein
MDKSSKNETIKTYVCVNTQTQKDSILKTLPSLDVVITDRPDRIGVAYPSYYLSSRVEGNSDDVVIFASDDFLPPNNWDKYISEKLKGREGCLMVNDGYQALDFSNMAEPVFSIPIMTYSALLKMNKIIYNPAYNHLCSDAEHYLNAEQLKLIIDERSEDKDFVFEHFHWSNGKRNPDQNDQNYYSKFENDKDRWEIRRKLSLNERLQVPI